MAKFPTEIEESVTVPAPVDEVYAFLWDVVGSSICIPGIDRCESVGPETYRFIYKERSTGPVSMIVRYTARYRGNGKDEITFEGISAGDDNTDVRGQLRLAGEGANTRITLKQRLAPDTPVPWLLQSLIRSFVEAETAGAARDYLANLRKSLTKA
ncbi:MAG TPA: SRPBCC family protein [Candidatus Limnocylindrales bacterium]|nr:SRPBCC family protein [Candidatus Limnocylindrales bacterium]